MYLWLIFQRFGSVLNALKDNFPFLNLSVYFHEIDENRQTGDLYRKYVTIRIFQSLSRRFLLIDSINLQILDLQDYISGYLYSSLSNWF